MATSTENLWSHRRLALIIGNENYKSNKRLENTINDAQQIKTALERCHFKVEMSKNIEKEMMETITNFSKTINEGDFVLFYFSGYSYSVDSINYLIPIDDSRIQDEDGVRQIGCSASNILTRLVKNNQSYVTIFILNCAVPYTLPNADKDKKETFQMGLSEMDPPPETFIQFSCDAHQTSTNLLGGDANRLFSQHLLRQITVEHITIGEMFQRVSDGVYQDSNGKQRPLSKNGLKKHANVSLNKEIIEPALEEVWETVVDECAEELMKMAVEQTVEEIKEKHLEFIAEQAIEKVIEILVSELLKEITPSPIAIHEYKLLIQLLKADASALMLHLPCQKNTHQNKFLREKLGETVELITDLEVALFKAIKEQFGGRVIKN